MRNRQHPQWLACALILGGAISLFSQAPGNSPPDGGPDFDGPPAFEGGPPGMMQEEIKLVKKFDQNGDGWLNQAERKAARESLSQKSGNRGRGGPGGGRGFGGPGEQQSTPQPGPKVSPSEVKPALGESLYASNVVRTFFLEFETADWEKELEAFHGTDVEVPAKLTVDGKTYPNVGVHFRGMSSYMMVGTGRKRSLALSLDYIQEDQNVGGYRTLHLLNAHGDPSFLRAVLSCQIARDYLPAPQANLVRVVINGESWGVYVNRQHFNKDFLKDWYNTKKGARWKVPGSPGGQGSLAYLGDAPASYKRIYEIKSKDETKSWNDLIRLCKTLNETPPDKLEAALAPLLDIDGALKFLAHENVLINNDGYWVRSSDYNLYEDERGRFHIIPCDVNECFSKPGGPGGPGGFGPGMMLARQALAQADGNGDKKLTQAEFAALADTWYNKLDSEKTGKLDQKQFIAKLGELLPPPPGFGPPAGGASEAGPQPGERRPGRGGPAMFIGAGLFSAFDADKNESLTRADLKDTLAKWFSEWDADKSGALDEEKLGKGFSAALPRPNFRGPGGGPGGQEARRGAGGPRGPGGPGGNSPRVNGVELDPLVAANDPSKPLISKLLAVPALRTRYLGYVRDIAEKWLDWNKLGPLAEQYHALIAAEVKADTRKLSTFEAFQKSVSGEAQGEAVRGPERTISLKSFAEQRRAYLLSHPEITKLKR